MLVGQGRNEQILVWQATCKYLQEGEGGSTTSLGNLWHCSVKKKKVFPDVEMAPPVFQFVHFASCPVPGHHSVKSLVFAPFFQVLVHVDEIPP